MDNFKTSSKLSLLESQHPHPPPPPPPPSSLSSNLNRNKILIKIFFSLIILLALITGGMIINLIQKYNRSQQKLKLDQQSESIRVFCSVTRFHSHCLDSIILLPDSNPDDIFIASLDSAIERVVNLTILTRALILQSTESRTESAIFKCSSLIDDSLNRLNRSLTAAAKSSFFGLRVYSDDEVEMSVKERIKEVSPWVNEAVSDLWRCFGILGEDNSTAAIELGSGVHDGIMHVSNIYDFLDSRFRIIDEIRSRGEINELLYGPEYYTPPRDDWVYISIFAPQYFVLIFLLCILLRIYF